MKKRTGHYSGAICGNGEKMSNMLFWDKFFMNDWKHTEGASRCCILVDRWWWWWWMRLQFLGVRHTSTLYRAALLTRTRGIHHCPRGESKSHYTATSVYQVWKNGAILQVLLLQNPLLFKLRSSNHRLDFSQALEKPAVLLIDLFCLFSPSDPV